MNPSTRTTVLLLRDPTLRRLLGAILPAKGWRVESVGTLAEARLRADGGAVVLADWERLDGLMSEERREELRSLGHSVRLAALVPAFWRRYLSADDLGVAALLAKPFDLVEVLAALDAATVRPRSEVPVDGRVLASWSQSSAAA